MFNLNDKHTLLEMALVGKTSDNVEIRVYGKEEVSSLVEDYNS